MQQSEKFYGGECIERAKGDGFVKNDEKMLHAMKKWKLHFGIQNNDVTDDYSMELNSLILEKGSLHE
jgi:hypothetical protein